VLIIEARHERTRKFAEQRRSALHVGPAHHARIATWTYGFFEIARSCPVDAAPGLRSGCWASMTKGRWPDVGEIDIMEHVGFDPGVVHGTIHTKAYNHVIHTARGSQVSVPDACTAFHRYQLSWTPDRLIIGADDHPYFQFDREMKGGHDVWPFDAPNTCCSTSPSAAHGADSRASTTRPFPRG